MKDTKNGRQFGDVIKEPDKLIYITVALMLVVMATIIGITAVSNRARKNKLPENDMYPGFWKNPLTMQHPLSKIEIVAFDASYTIIFTKDFALPEKFKEFYPKAENLELLNCSL